MGMSISPPFWVRVKYLDNFWKNCPEICYKQSKFQYMKYKKLWYVLDFIHDLFFEQNTCKTNDIPISL